MTDKIRPSPTQSATLYKIGTIKTGNDGNKWIIVENKNNIKKWKLHKKVTKKVSKINKKSEKEIINLENKYGFTIISNEELKNIAIQNEKTKNIYNIIETKIIPELNNINFNTFIVPIANYDLSNDDIYTKYLKLFYNINLKKIKDYIIFTFYLDKTTKKILLNEDIEIVFSHQNKDNKIKLINIFEKYLRYNYKWTGSNMHTMHIQLEKNKNIKKIDQTTLVDNDMYPMLKIEINFKKHSFNSTELFNKFYKYLVKTKHIFELEGDIKKFEIFIFSINNQIIDKIRSFIKSQEFIKSSEFHLYETPKNKKII